MEVPPVSNFLVNLKTRGIRKFTPIGGGSYYQVPWYEFGIFGGDGKSTSPKDALEYKTMTNRFNTAYRVSKHQMGSKVEPKNKWAFSRRTKNLGNGYQVLSDWIYQSRLNGQWTGDMAPTMGGRTIYVTPNGNDTVFWRTDDRYMWGDNSGLMPIPEKSKDLKFARNNFYRWVPRTTAENDRSIAPRNRALKGN